MPGTNKTAWAQLRVGLLAIAALAIIGVLIFLMAGSQGFFATRSTIYTYLGDSAAVAQGAPVTLNGVSIDGKITKVELSGSSQPNRIVRVTMEIGQKYLSSIPVDSQTELASANLLGTKYINIKRGMSSQTIKAGAELASSDTAEIEDLFRQGSETLAALQSVVGKLNDIVSQVEVGKGSIGKLFVDETLYNSAVGLIDQFQKLGVDLHTTINSSDNSVGKLLHDNGALYDDVHGIMANVNTVVDGINSGKGTLGQLAQNPAAYNDTRQVLGDVHKLLAGIDAGQGTVGKLLKTDEFGDTIKTTLGKVDSLLDKMNNGNGTVARLLNDPALYEDLDAVTREAQGLLKDFRANPKKFLRIKMSIF